MGSEVFRNYCKGHMDKTKGKGERGKRGMMVGLVGVEWRDGDKMQTTIIEQQ